MAILNFYGASSGGGSGEVGPFGFTYLGAFPQSTTDDLYIVDGSVDFHKMLADGSITRFYIYTSDPRTAGTLSAKITKNGAPLTGALDLLLDGTNPQEQLATVAASTAPYTFVQTDNLGVQLQSDGTWAPNTGITVVISAVLWVQL